jgi:HK97 family phage prohead protease
MAEFKTKTFNMLTPFSLVEKEASILDSATTLTISGYANYSGPDSTGKTYVDLVGDVVSVEGMDVSMWASNPIILMNHSRDQVIGRGIKVEKRSDGVFIEAEIHKEAMTPQDWYRIKAGLICRYSIGFRTLDGMYKEVDGEEIFFITKSLLMESSCVSLPCNQMSAFSVVKSMPDGTFTNDPKEKYKELIVPTNDNTQEDAIMNIKVRRADLLKGTELETFKQLGGDAEAEVEISLADFIKGIVADALTTAFDAKAAEEAAKQAEADAAALIEAEAKAAEEKAELDELKSIIESLKALAVEEK